MEEEKRGFFDVFTGLKAPDELRQLFQEVQVLKVSMSRSKNIMYVTILSPRLIHKKYIFAMEREIKRYLGRGSEIGIKIREKYNDVYSIEEQAYTKASQLGNVKYGDISDVISGATQGRLDLGVGHPASYWKKAKIYREMQSHFLSPHL